MGKELGLILNIIGLILNVSMVTIALVLWMFPINKFGLGYFILFFGLLAISNIIGIVYYGRKKK